MYWRADDFVAIASMDELTGSWLVDENGEIGEDTPTDTWTVDWLGKGGALDKQDEIEATENALRSLLAHGVVEDKKRDDRANFKFLTKRWGKDWRMKDDEWKRKVPFAVGRTQRGSVLSWCKTLSWTCDRLHSFEVEAGDV